MLGRGALFDRLTFAVEKAAELGARHVLDVGCGSGPLFRPLAERGIRVTGIDPAPRMAALAEQTATELGDLVEFRRQGWEELDEHERYDLAVALGVFDYVPNPEDLLRVMARAAPHVVGSFPSEGIRTDLRRVRYRRHGVEVHGFDQARLSWLADKAGGTIVESKPLGRAGAAVHFSTV